MRISSVWMRTKEGMRDKLLELAKDLMENTRKEPGCIEYTYYPSTEDDQGVFVFEVWDSEETSKAETPHMQTEHYLRYRKAREGMIEDGSFKVITYEAQEVPFDVSKLYDKKD